MEKHPYRVIKDSGDLTRLPEVLASDVVFHSPFFDRPVVGRDLVVQVMVNSHESRQGAYVNEFRDGNLTVLVWSGEVDGRSIQRLVLIEDDADGRIKEYTSAIRPFSSAVLFRRAMHARVAPLLPADTWDLPDGIVDEVITPGGAGVARSHVVVPSDDTYEVVLERLDASLGGSEPVPFPALVADSAGPDDFVAKVEARLGPSGFAKFYEVDHAPWMALIGVRVRSKQFVIGNPLIARNIVPHDPAAGGYVPLRIGVYEDEAGRAWFQYDRPSAHLGLFSNPRIDEVGRLLDEKVAELAMAATTGR